MYTTSLTYIEISLQCNGIFSLHVRHTEKSVFSAMEFSHYTSGIQRNQSSVQWNFLTTSLAYREICLQCNGVFSLQVWHTEKSVFSAMEFSHFTSGIQRNQSSVQWNFLTTSLAYREICLQCNGIFSLQVWHTEKSVFSAMEFSHYTSGIQRNQSSVQWNFLMMNLEIAGLKMKKTTL